MLVLARFLWLHLGKNVSCPDGISGAPLPGGLKVPSHASKANPLAGVGFFLRVL